MTVTISNKVIEKLRFSVIDPLGGITNVINLLGVEKLNLLAVHPDEVFLVTRADHVIQLAYSKRDYYSVYDLDGYLQYQIRNHSGLYGTHLLDDLYLSTLRSGSLFYIHYEIDPNRYLNLISNPNKHLLVLYV
jgi:hypothetical protein